VNFSGNSKILNEGFFVPGFRSSLFLKEPKESGEKNTAPYSAISNAEEVAWEVATEQT